MPSDCMRVLLLRRLRLPLPHTPRHCRCGGTLDALGDHRAACQQAFWARAARLLNKQPPGSAVKAARGLRDMNFDVPLADSRRIEVLANGLPLWQGAQVAVDTTFVSPISRDGTAQRGRARTMCRAKRQQARHAGNARPRTRSCWPPVGVGWWCWRLRWADASVPKWRIFSAAWPPPKRGRRRRGFGLQPARRQATAGRMLAVAAQRAFLSLLELPLDRADEGDGAQPPLADLLAHARHVYPVAESRMPLRA